ncbi:hypothetical protein BMS3Bbin15_00938 [archaeon BMS3Bbin15]|nr:hypothetical protein BMS3Bbin15_00938 [archaeon BMS3Bbin15]
MGKPIKEVFLNILEDWESSWKKEIPFRDFLTDYIEINDDKKTYIIKRRKKSFEEK